MAEAVSEDLVLDFGAPGEVAPSGVGQAPLEGPAGYKFTLGQGVVRASRKAGSGAIGISVPWTVAVVGVGVSDEQVGRTGESWLSLPEGSDRSDTPKGRGNKARIAEVKSFFVAAGVSLENVDKLLCGGSLTVKRLNAALGKVKEKAAVVYYGPPAGDDIYPEMKWISPDNADGVMSGALKPKLKGSGKRGGVGAGNVDTFMDDEDDAPAAAKGAAATKGGGDEIDDWA